VNGGEDFSMDTCHIDTDTDHCVFILCLKARPGVAGIHALRALLKALLRRHGVRCLHALEIGERQ